MNNQEKGLLYEKYVKDFIIKNLSKNAYLWNECPENILIDNNLIHSHNTMRKLRKDIKEGNLHNHKDIGIDIIQVEKDKCSIIQCKNGYNNGGLRVDDIAGIMMRCAFLKDVNTFIYYTSCLSRNIIYTADISPYVINIDLSNNIDNLIEVSNDNKIYFVKLPYEDSHNIIEDIVTEMIAYPYQIEAFNAFKKHYQFNSRGILSLPCACGKTYVSLLISNDYSHIIILSPLREFARQNLNRFVEYGYDKNNTLLVDTDGNRDIDSIKKFIKDHTNMIISCTYNSMDLISECLDLFKDALFIIDEFHNLSKANVSQEDNKIYKLLNSNHRILFMSATPRIYDIEYDIEDSTNIESLFGDIVYKMTFTDAIANKYITDYKIWLPSIHENNEELDKELSIYEVDNELKNRCRFLYSCISNNGSRKCIVYCKDTEDMKIMMECMEILNEFYIMNIDMYSISCEDSNKQRKSVLNCFTNNEDNIQLLFNIKILNECVDIPACDSVYISYAPKNKITTIQRLSRSIRKNKNNPYKIANIYVWCEAYEDILETLSSIKEYDIIFKDKVKINALDFYHSKEDKNIELIVNDKVLLCDYIMGIKEFKIISWEEKLNILEDYIKEYGKLPTSHNIDKNVKSLASWISSQRQNYKNTKKIMKNENIRKLWDDFVKQYHSLFISNTEVWINNLKTLADYIEVYNKLPSDYSKDENILKIARWKSTQKQNYKNLSHIMKDESIKKIWEEFVKKHIVLFRSNEEKWLENISELEKYIQYNKKLPSHTNEEENIILIAKWVTLQKRNYEKKEQIMIYEDIRKIWADFVNKYQEVFKSDDDRWIDNFNNLKEYIKTYKKIPSRSDKDAHIKYLGLWTRNNVRSYKNNENIMKKDAFRILWKEFMDDNKLLFLKGEEFWIENKNKVEKYIQEFNKLPSRSDKIQEISALSNWITLQKKNYIKKEYIMIDENIRKIWADFVKQYETYFISNEEIWMSRFDELNEYINKYNKLPLSCNTENNTLVQWLRHQKRNYESKNQIMKNETIRKYWKEFIDNNSNLFITTDDIWIENKNKVEKYIQEFNKLPSQANKDKNVSSLASWISAQKQNYKNKENIMKNNNNIIKEWECFIEKHSILFRSNEEVWMDTLQNVSEYIQHFNKLPSQANKDKNVSSLASWISAQKQNYDNNEQIMINEDIRKIWADFVNNYQKIFKSKEDIRIDNFNNLKEYINIHNKLPSRCNKDENIKYLGSYVHHQKHNYKNNTNNMKDASLRKEWEDFIAKYPHLF